ncbi:hypothetical protein, partial [Cellulosimicrobium sp. TH-20]|uniref:hypothetical protein n=1 Tax=Cellulosimicrobium sp. TH-20 TaxID=1980001 RepID=UPI001C9984D8
FLGTTTSFQQDLVPQMECQPFLQQSHPGTDHQACRQTGVPPPGITAGEHVHDETGAAEEKP